MSDEETIAFRMTLVAGASEEYRRRHDAIWPELRSALQAAGVIDYHIFHEPGSTSLFAIMRRRADHKLEELSRSKLMHEWWTMMSDVVVSDERGVPLQTSLQEVFRLD
jgi:L-rhamnose mutarotase